MTSTALFGWARDDGRPVSGPTQASISNATARILSAARSTIRFDRKTGETTDGYRKVPVWTEKHSGPALVGAGTAGGDQEAAEEPVVTNEIVVRIAPDADVAPDDRATWIDTNDPQLQDKVATVLRVSYGDLQPVRRVVVQLVTAEVD